MSYAPRRSEDDIYPEDDCPGACDDTTHGHAVPERDYYPDPDFARDLAMEREWAAEALTDLDDQREWGYGGKTGGYVDTYMVDTYGGAK